MPLSAELLPDPAPFACAECGTTTATSYVVTILDRDDLAGTTTEVCLSCHEALSTPEQPVSSPPSGRPRPA